MISAALRAIAAHVDDQATSAPWDQHQRFTDEQRAARAEKIRAVATEMRVLADASEVRQVRYPEYEALKDRLNAFGLSLPLKLDQDVALAFREARGPAKPRGKGWLKPS